MEFAQFFQMVATGAMVIIAGLLAWTVKEVVRLAGTNTRMETAMNTLEKRMEKVEGKANGVDQLNTKLAVLEERSANTVTALSEIKALLASPPPPPRRRATS